MSQKITINIITRTTEEGFVETLELKPGVNILEGPPNSGKTVWLNLIDYLMGDTGSIEEVLANEDISGKKLYEKYIAASMSITIGGKKIHLERRWTEPGNRGKIFIDNYSVLAQDFSDYILNELQIPILHFPKGNPFSDKSWPSLSWRMMLRHIFRRENFWSDLADKQPENEQHAVLTQFLGIADKLFSQHFGDVVDKRKQLIKLEAEKEQFSSILDNIGKSMASPNENISFITHETIKKAIDILEQKIKTLLDKRQGIINDELTKVEQENEINQNYVIEKTTQRQELIEKIAQLNQKQKGLIARISEFDVVQHNIKQEIDRLDRTKEAGNLFADFKITHCPACDNEIKHSSNIDTDNCFLCHQPLQKEQVNSRLDFEISQLTAEKDEIVELICSLKRDDHALKKYKEKLQYDLALIDREIAPLRNKMSALLSPEVGNIDAERGRLEEQIEGHKRILRNLDYKDELIHRIDSLTSEITKLEALLDSQENEINYEEISNYLEEGMTNYLDELVKNNPDRWPYTRPKFRIGEKGFTLKVNEGKWSKTLGATSTLYFLFAYHYALLALSKIDFCNYPGLLIIDFPPELPNTEKNIIISENYVVEPFINLCNTSEVPIQVIIAGNAFRHIQGVNKIAMSKNLGIICGD
jgi:hypothetical protein